MRKTFTYLLVLLSFSLFAKDFDIKQFVKNQSRLKADSGPKSYMLDTLKFEYNYDGEWKTDAMYTFYYSEDGNVFEVHEHSAYESGQYIWKLSYDAMNNVTGLLGGVEVDHPYLGTMFLPNEEYEIEYNSNGYETSYIEHLYDENGNKTPDRKITTEYTTNTETTTIYYIDESTNDWGLTEYSSKYVGTIDGDKMLNDTSFRWNVTDQKFDINALYEYKYEDGLQVAHIEKIYSSYANDFTNRSKYEFEYDEDGNLIAEKDYDWSTSENDWEIAGMYENTYDKSMNISNVAYTSYGQFETEYCDFTHAPISSEFKYWAETEFLSEGRTLHIFSEFEATAQTATSAIELSMADVSVYPNPASEKLFVESNINNGTVSVINIAGSIMYSGGTSETSVIDISNWQAGIYTCIITSENGIVRNTVVVK